MRYVTEFALHGLGFSCMLDALARWDAGNDVVWEMNNAPNNF